MKLPAAVITYAALAILTGIADLLSAVWLFFIQPSALGSIIANAFWAVFSLCLGWGILRLRPAWRIVALVGSWIVFILFGLILVCWCIWPQSVRGTVLVALGAAAALNLWFYLAFRSDPIRSLFLGRSLHTIDLADRSR